MPHAHVCTVWFIVISLYRLLFFVIIHESSLRIRKRRKLKFLFLATRRTHGKRAQSRNQRKKIIFLPQFSKKNFSFESSVVNILIYVWPSHYLKIGLENDAQIDSEVQVYI